MLILRNETEKDHQAVETLTRRAFYNVHTPGCSEHYLVHILRGHPDFVPELDFVAELDGKVIGSIFYIKARLVAMSGAEKEILTFGPISVAPEHQRKGYGRMLIEHSFRRAAELGYDVVVIFGSPANYVGRGFQSCKKLGVCLEGGKYPAAMLVKELRPGALAGQRWIYHESPVMEVSEADAAAFDAALEPMEKKRLPSQEEFYIMSHAFLE